MSKKIIAFTKKENFDSPSNLLKSCENYINKARDAYFLGKLEEAIDFYHQALVVSLEFFKLKPPVFETEINTYLNAVKIKPADLNTIDLKHFVAAAMPQVLHNLNQGQRLIFLAGPSLAGKNSAAVILKENLEKQGLKSIIKDGDDYFSSKPINNQIYFNKPDLIKNTFIKHVSVNFDFNKMISNLDQARTTTENEILIVPIMDVIALSFPFQKYQNQFQVIELTPQNLTTKDYNKKQFRNFLFRHPVKTLLEIKYQRIFDEIITGLQFNLAKFKNYQPDIIFNRSKNMVEIPNLAQTIEINQPSELIINPFWQIALKENPDTKSLETYAKEANILPIFEYWKKHYNTKACIKEKINNISGV